MSLNPVLAALVGALLFKEGLGGIEWAGIALIVTANTIGLLLPSRTMSVTNRFNKS